MLWICLLLGALPFAAGGILNWCMITYTGIISLLMLIALLFLFIWGFVAFFLSKKGGSTKQIVVFLNLIAGVDLLLVGIQELILRAYWPNIVGAWSQLFYLPVLNLGFTLTSWSVHTVTAYTACFLLMVGASLAGCKIREKYQ